MVRKGIHKIDHPWDLTPEAAIALQTELAPRVIRKSRIKSAGIVTVAGVDAGYSKDRAHAAAVVLSLKDLKVLSDLQEGRGPGSTHQRDGLGSEIQRSHPLVIGASEFREGVEGVTTPLVLLQGQETLDTCRLGNQLEVSDHLNG